MAFGIKWLKPEIDEPKYFGHIYIIALIAQLVLPFFNLPVGSIFTLDTVYIGLAIVVADIFAHTILKLE